LFVTLDEFQKTLPYATEYFQRLDQLKQSFLNMQDVDLMSAPSVILSKIRLLKAVERSQEAFELLDKWMKTHGQSDVLKMEYIKLLIAVGRSQDALDQTQELLNTLRSSLTRHFCSQCGYNSDEIFWRCPQCHNWETIQFRWKV
jgi:lipopolysaccharide biosynthesis regulator YciM